MDKNYESLMNKLREHFNGIKISFSFVNPMKIVSTIIDTDWSTAKLHHYSIIGDMVLVFDDFEYSETYNKVIKVCYTFKELVKFIQEEYDSWWKGWEEFDKKTRIENS